MDLPGGPEIIDSVEKLGKIENVRQAFGMVSLQLSVLVGETGIAFMDTYGNKKMGFWPAAADAYRAFKESKITEIEQIEDTL